MFQRTLDISYALLQNLLQNLGVLELLLDLGDDGGGQLLLLALLDLALVADPGVEDGLGLGSQGGLLLELESLSLKLGSLLYSGSTSWSHNMVLLAIYLGDLKEGLGDVDNAAHLLDVLNAGLDGLGVVGAGAVEDVLDLLVLSLGPLLVGRAAVLEQTSPDGQQAHGNDRLLVHDVVLIAEGIDGETGGTTEEGGLADEAAAGKGVDDALGLLLGLLGGHVARVSHGGGRNRRGGSGDGGSEEGRCACSFNCSHCQRLGAPIAIEPLYSAGFRFCQHIPTALRTKRDAIVRTFRTGYLGLVVDIGSWE